MTKNQKYQKCARALIQLVAPLTCSAAARSPGGVGPAQCVWSAQRCPVSQSGCASPAQPADLPAGLPSTS